MRLSVFLIQDKNLTECTAKEKKAHTKTALEFVVKNNIFLNLDFLDFNTCNSGMLVVVPMSSSN